MRTMVFLFLFVGCLPIVAAEPGLGLPPPLSDNPSISSTIPPTDQYMKAINEAQNLESQLKQVASRSDAMMKAKVSGTTGPQVYSVDTLWNDLSSLVEGSKGLIEDVRKLLQTSDMKIGAVGDQLVQSIASVQSNIDKVTASLLLLSSELKDDINKIVPQVSVSLTELIKQVNASVGGVSDEIEAGIKALSDAGIKQVDIIGNDLNNILVTVKDSTSNVTKSITTTIGTFKDDMKLYLGNVSVRFDELFQLLKEAGITQIVTHIDEGIVNIMKTVNDGIRQFNEVITSKIDGIGDKIIAILEEVRLTMVSVKETMQKIDETVNKISGDVVSTAAGVRSLTEKTTGYIKNLEVDASLDIMYGPERFSPTDTDRTYTIDGGINIAIFNIVRSNNKHYLVGGFEDIEGDPLWNIEYGHRVVDLFAVEGGIIRNRLGLGVEFGNLRQPPSMKKSSIRWGIGARYYGLGEGQTLDARAQFGQRNGVYAYSELRDIINGGIKNWHIGVGGRWTF